jgi:hypothetical protein
MPQFHRTSDGKWVDMSTGEELGSPGKLTADNFERAPYSPHISSKVSAFLQKVVGVDLEVKHFSQLDGITFDKPNRSIKGNLIPKAPDKFEERLIVPDQHKNEFRTYPSNFSINEIEGKFVVQPKEWPAPVIPEDPDDIVEMGKDELCDDEPAVSLMDLQTNAMEQAKEKARRRGINV